MEISRRHFDDELRELKTHRLRMGGTVEAMVADAVEALSLRDAARAQAVEASDREVDFMEMKADRLAAGIIALRQPAASDLRHVIAALKISTDLERIGDLAANLASRVVEQSAEPPLDPDPELPGMATRVRDMTARALQAFVDDSAAEARKVLTADQEVDDMHRRIFFRLRDRMLADREVVERATRLMFISKYLERIADHATNVAEEVIFAVEGVDVRHGQGREIEPA